MNLRARGPEAGLGVKAVASRPDSPDCCVLKWAASGLSKGNLPGLKQFLKHQTALAPTNEGRLNLNPITAKSGKAAKVLYSNDVIMSEGCH